MDELFDRSQMVSLHCPLTPDTHHLLDDDRFGRLPAGALVVNTSRGGLIDATAAVRALKSGHLGGLAIDVYEEEADLFFEDRSEQILTDDVFARLLSFPQRIDHQPSGVLHPRSAAQHRPDHTGQCDGLPNGRGGVASRRIGGMNPSAAQGVAQHRQFFGGDGVPGPTAALFTGDQARLAQHRQMVTDRRL